MPPPPAIDIERINPTNDGLIIEVKMVKGSMPGTWNNAGGKVKLKFSGKIVLKEGLAVITLPKELESLNVVDQGVARFKIDDRKLAGNVISADLTATAKFHVKTPMTATSIHEVFP